MVIPEAKSGLELVAPLGKINSINSRVLVQIDLLNQKW